MRLSLRVVSSRAAHQTIATNYKFLDCELQSITLHATCSLAFWRYFRAIVKP
jgi:hypothetical protein